MLKNFAEDLKRQRELKNISIKEIAEGTRLGSVAFENIENGDFTFQPQTYIRAFIKQYSKFIGLDPEQTLKDYDLARAGKYVPKFSSESEETASTTQQDNITKEQITKDQDKESLKDNIVEDSNIKGYEKKDDIFEENKINKISDSKPISSYKPDKINVPVSPSYNYEKKSSNFNFNILKNVGIILFVLLILAGLFWVVKIIFLDNSDNKEQQIIRQNFDDVVKESERKILGKKTEEEIQDSIRKVEDLKQKQLLENQPINLEIKALKDGWVIIASDSLGIKNPTRTYLKQNQDSIFTAKNFFLVSSLNTSAFEIKLNGKPLTFPPKISKLKVDKNGIVELEDNR